MLERASPACHAPHLAHWVGSHSCHTAHAPLVVPRRGALAAAVAIAAVTQALHARQQLDGGAGGKGGGGDGGGSMPMSGGGRGGGGGLYTIVWLIAVHTLDGSYVASTQP
eukprot:356704-Chlamydomonas_euryale.AAC.8